MSQPAAKKQRTGVSAALGSTITDTRFTNIQSDPRYRLPGRKHKIKVDKRFAKALQDDDFSRKAKVDRYGRPVEVDSEKKRLKRKYEFEEDANELPSQSDEPDDDDEVQAELERATETRDLLREGKDVSSSEEEESSSDEETSEEEDNAQVTEAGPGPQDQHVPMGEVSSRLAVVNVDWDNIRAEDLMAVFQSFLPPTGRLLKVAIYPSEFGKERIEREETEGPPREIFANSGPNEDSESEGDEDDNDIKDAIVKPDDGSEFDSAALRQYQLDRLRYYYAVLTFSNSQTAKTIYDAVDGTEYLSTANFFDLRFIPDETDFSDDVPREECERIPPNYKPNEFVTDALQHSKVKLTWDADDTTRKEAQARAFRGSRKEIDENDLKAYLASDSDSEEEEPEALDSNTSRKEAERQRMRALLGLAPEPVKKPSKDKKATPLGNIQITFSSGLSGLADKDDDTSDEEDGTSTKTKKKRNVFENSPEPNETTVEKYVRREKERKQRRKEKMKTNRDGDADQPAAAAENTQEANNTQEQDLGFEDPFFAAPTHDAASASKQRKAERLQRRAEREAEEAASAKQRAALEALMADNDADPNSTGKRGRTVKHFDMTEIEKAEKAAAKKQDKKNKHKNKNKKAGMRVDHEAVLAADEFKIDAADPRFTRIYENHEFAIDPTNPRYKGTKGMKTLLEEGRKRKETDVGKVAKGSTRQGQGSSVQENEVMGLVEKIKRKNR